MVFLGNLNRVTDVKSSIGLIHYMPLDAVNGLGKSKEQLEQEGILLESIPQPQQIEGKSPMIYVNPMTKEVFYEYVDIPKTQEELTNERITMLEQAINDLILGGM